jgi:regulator of sigma E protease
MDGLIHPPNHIAAQEEIALDFPVILENLRGIFNLLIILSVLVVVHEWGHFIAAKAFKMRVEEFALFFGKVLIRLGVRDGTVYNIRAIPAGGFVRIAGMEADDISGGRPILEAIRNPMFNDSSSMDKILKDLEVDSMAGIDTSRVSEDFRKKIQWAIGPDGKLTDEGLADLEALRRSPQINTDEHKLLDIVLQAHSRANDPGLYSQKPIYQRAIVIFAGPLASLLFGYLIFCVMGMTVGMTDERHPTNQIALMQNMPAQKAGLKPGDRIIAINGQPTLDGQALVKGINTRPGMPTALTIKRGPSTFQVTVTPRPFEKRDAKGEIVKENGKTVMIGRIGVIPIGERRRLGPVESIKQGTLTTIGYARMLVTTIFSRQVKDNIGGPIAMGQIATQHQQFGIAGLLNMAAMFSISLGVMNLLPIPILDGGHLLLLAIEKLRRRKLSPREVYRAQMVGLGILAMLVAFVFYNDIARIVSGKSF